VHSAIVKSSWNSCGPPFPVRGSSTIPALDKPIHRGLPRRAPHAKGKIDHARAGQHTAHVKEIPNAFPRQSPLDFLPVAMHTANRLTQLPEGSPLSPRHAEQYPLTPTILSTNTCRGAQAQQEARMAISYNVPITFGSAGTAKSLNCVGIDFSEDGGRSWTSAPVAELDIQLPLARQDVVVELEAAPFVIPDVVSTQNVFIFIGGLFVGFWNLTAHHVRPFPVHRSVMSGRPTRMALVIPTAASPSDLGLSEDLRQLGIYLTSIAFKTSI